MLYKTRAIVLHAIRYGESSLVVHCYTERYGRQSFMLKGVRKSRKNNRANLFQPLFILDMEVYHKANRDMQLVKEVSRTVPLNSLPYDITKSTQAIFMAEILYRVVKEEEPNPVLAQFLLSTIQYLDAIEEPLADFHIIFMFHLSRYLGFFPQNDYSESNKYFDLLSGQFKPHVTDPDLQLDESGSMLWSKYIGLDYEEAEQAGFNSSQRKIMLDSLIRYYRNHVAGMGEIKSLEVLHAYFHNL